MEQSKKASYGKRNRNKGNDAERLYAKLFREFGFDKCITSREGSRLYDSCKIDLMFLPFLVQVKAGRQSTLSATKVFQEMREEIKKAFPETAPEQTLPKLLIHHREKSSGKFRDEYDQLVILSFKDFIKLLNLKKNDTPNT